MSKQIECVSGVGRIIEAGVDWLTITSKEPEKQERLQSLGQALIYNEHERGEKCSPWRLFNFEGYKCGGVALAVNDEMTYMRLSSALAWSYWREAYQFASNCSRFDLQVTVTDVGPPEGVVLDCHQQALRHIASWKRKPEVALRMSNRSSPTLYFNQRTSSRFGRIYDKANETKKDHYRGAVRFEVQFNDETAWSMSKCIYRSTKFPQECTPFVSYFFGTRGVGSEFLGDVRRGVVPPRPSTNDDRRLEWLRRQCAPAVQELLKRGRVSEVYIALGLPVPEELDHNEEGEN